LHFVLFAYYSGSALACYQEPYFKLMPISFLGSLGSFYLSFVSQRHFALQICESINETYPEYVHL